MIKEELEPSSEASEKGAYRSRPTENSMLENSITVLEEQINTEKHKVKTQLETKYNLQANGPIN